MGTKEYKTIQVTAYRNKKGVPVCASDFVQGDFCNQLRVEKFGTIHVCGYTGTLLHNDEDGWLRPANNCPYWKEQD